MEVVALRGHRVRMVVLVLLVLGAHRVCVAFRARRVCVDTLVRRVVMVVMGSVVRVVPAVRLVAVVVVVVMEVRALVVVVVAPVLVVVVPVVNTVVVVVVVHVVVVDPAVLVVVVLVDSVALVVPVARVAHLAVPLFAGPQLPLAPSLCVVRSPTRRVAAMCAVRDCSSSWVAASCVPSPPTVAAATPPAYRLGGTLCG